MQEVQESGGGGALHTGSVTAVFDVTLASCLLGCIARGYSFQAAGSAQLNRRVQQLPVRAAAVLARLCAYIA